jgi:hypothetical protein
MISAGPGRPLALAGGAAVLWLTVAVEPEVVRRSVLDDAVACGLLSRRAKAARDEPAEVGRLLLTADLPPARPRSEAV